MSDSEFLGLRRQVAAMADTLDRHGSMIETLVDTVAEQRRDFVLLTQTVADGMQNTITVVERGFADLRGELRGEVGGLRTEMRGEMAELRTEMHAGFSGVRATFDQVESDIHDIRDRLAS